MKKETDGGSTYIWCQDPGTSSCPWIAQSTGENSAVINVQSQIANGVLTGSYLDPVINCVVTWDSDNTAGSNSKITIVPPGQTAHEEYLPKP